MQRWKAQIKVSGRDVNLGRHSREDAAARAYDRRAGRPRVARSEWIDSLGVHRSNETPSHSGGVHTHREPMSTARVTHTDLMVGGKEIGLFRHVFPEQGRHLCTGSGGCPAQLPARGLSGGGRAARVPRHRRAGRAAKARAELAVRCDHRLAPGIDSFCPKHTGGRDVTCARRRGVDQRLQQKTSRFHGVRRNKRTGKFEAYLRHQGRHVHLGCHVAEEHAARCYDQAVLNRHYAGEGRGQPPSPPPDTSLNFPFASYQAGLLLVAVHDSAGLDCTRIRSQGFRSPWLPDKLQAELQTICAVPLEELAEALRGPGSRRSSGDLPSSGSGRAVEGKQGTETAGSPTRQQLRHAKRGQVQEGTGGTADAASPPLRYLPTGALQELIEVPSKQRRSQSSERDAPSARRSSLEQLSRQLRPAAATSRLASFDSAPWGPCSAAAPGQSWPTPPEQPLDLGMLAVISSDLYTGTVAAAAAANPFLVPAGAAERAARFPIAPEPAPFLRAAEEHLLHPGQEETDSAETSRRHRSENAARELRG